MQHHSIPPSPHKRRGVTLTEVLMAILVMGIGVVAVATMFPLSVLKSVRASHLTRAAILCVNARARVQSDPRLLADPDFDGNFKEHFSNDFNRNGIFDRGEVGEDVDGDGNPDRVRRGLYVVDPLGWAYWTDVGISAGVPANVFGHDDDDSAAPFGIRRWSGSALNGPAPDILTQLQAEQIVALPDTWETVGEDAILPASTSTVLQLASTDLDLSVVPLTGNPLARVVLFLSTPNAGPKAVTRRIVAVNDTTKTITVSPAITGVTTANVDRVRVEFQSPKYTWMLTVHTDMYGVSSADIVVFFNRSFDPLDERLISTPAASGFINADRNASNVVTINWMAAANKPNYGQNKFLYSTANGQWYRIVQVQAETATSATLVLDRAVSDVPVKLPAAEDNAIIPSGVIDVFPY
ncbi:type IV pilus modification PilV family protein [Thalassoroseus pseudoceratinae]|uniref:type IV pilus modification PilV family protein n=1 Tax=Thalassoroseus pseudoceratinae TaxID=2713176 RepID=UPI0014237084|nr:prepilin-type N-terminal cleavage/methylation domain-containing protein [Thalassoroseus pseudoceratinae]